MRFPGFADRLFSDDYHFCFVYAVFKVRPSFSLFPMLFIFNSGGHLLSRTVSGAVPSADRVLTVVFGMGTGVAPDRIAARFSRFLHPLPIPLPKMLIDT